MRRGVWCWALAAAGATGLVIQLEAGERECFMLEVKSKAAVAGNFELIKPNKLAKPLWVTVTSEDAAKPLYESRGSPEGTFAFDAPGSGVIDMCLANGSKENTDGVSRSVGFAIRVTSTHTEIANTDEKTGSLTELLEFSEELNEGLLTLMDHQAYMRQREAGHRKVILTTKTRVYYWTCAECFVLVALAVWQILYIRAFFETKRSI